MTVGNKLGFPLKGNGSKNEKIYNNHKTGHTWKSQEYHKSMAFLDLKEKMEITSAIDSKDGAKEPDLVPWEEIL